MAAVDEASLPVETTDPHVLDEVYRLRVRAWRARQPGFPDMDRWTDDFDAVARHWVVIRDGAVVGAARLTVHNTLRQVPDAALYCDAVGDDRPGPIAVFTRLVVDRSYAATGISRALDRVRLRAARAAGCRLAILATFAGPKRALQLEELGFREGGEGGLYQSGPLVGLDRDGRRPAIVFVNAL